MVSKLLNKVDGFIELNEDAAYQACLTLIGVAALYGVLMLARHGIPAAFHRSQTRLEAILGDDVAGMVSDL